VSNAETQLLSYIPWQWDRYLVPQNVFLVEGKNTFILAKNVDNFTINIYSLFCKADLSEKSHFLSWFGHSLAWQRLQINC